jgi:hypothetical protein
MTWRTVAPAPLTCSRRPASTVAGFEQQPDRAGVQEPDRARVHDDLGRNPRQLVPQHRDFHLISIRRRAHAEHSQQPSQGHQTPSSDHHTPSRPGRSARVTAVALKRHLTVAQP